MQFLLAVITGVPMTLLLTIAGFAIGAVGGVPLALARRSKLWLPRAVARSIIELLRGIPPIVWIFAIYFGIGNGFLQVAPIPAAVAAFGVISCAYMAEIYRGGLSGVPSGQWEAGEALGLDHRSLLSRVIGPQVMRLSIPAAATYAIGLLKDTSIAYTIGVQEILFNADMQAKQSANAIGPYLWAALVYVVITIPCAWAARSLDAKLRRKVAR
ncbi:MAG: amino acid ABC transporter permease [Actinomycetes bacterium]